MLAALIVCGRHSWLSLPTLVVATKVASSLALSGLLYRISSGGVAALQEQTKRPIQKNNLNIFGMF